MAILPRFETGQTEKVKEETCFFSRLSEFLLESDGK